MQRRYYIIGISALLIVSFFIYRYFNNEKTDLHREYELNIPDSSWLQASINIHAIRKDIAWNTLLNGDLYKIVKTDTSSNTLIKLLRSPSEYGIREDERILYFSKWEHKQMYHGLIFKLDDSSKLQSSLDKSMHSDIIRTKEGIWIFDAYNLLFLFTEEKDSVTARKYFSQTFSSKPAMHSDSGLISCIIQTVYIPSEKKHPLVDSSTIRFHVTEENKLLQISWNYQSPFSEYTKNTNLIECHNEGLYYTGSFSATRLTNTFTSIPFYSEHKELFEPIVKLIQNNSIQATFNGWKKIRSYYYVSEMNDEFQLELKKKDTSFNEPEFTIQINNSNDSIKKAFLTYLLKNRLISYQKNSTYKIIPGNFDSELSLNDSCIFIQNKHAALHSYIANTTKEAAFLFNCQPEFINGLTESGIISKEILKSIYTIEQINAVGKRDSTGLSGNISISVKGDEHSFIQLMKIASILVENSKQQNSNFK